MSLLSLCIWLSKKKIGNARDEKMVQRSWWKKEKKRKKKVYYYFFSGTWMKNREKILNAAYIIRLQIKDQTNRSFYPPPPPSSSPSYLVSSANGMHSIRFFFVIFIFLFFIISLLFFLFSFPLSSILLLWLLLAGVQTLSRVIWSCDVLKL